MKWLIYPYTPKSIPIIKNKSLLKCGEVVQIYPFFPSNPNPNGADT